MYECVFVSKMLGWGGRGLGWVCLFVCLFLSLCWVWVGVGICLEKMPCDLRRPFSIVHVVTSA